MTTSSPRHGRDPGVTLIRISPARIQTQVTQTVKYRPVRSLLLLGLLVVISLFVLFTLSQMAVVQHTMMAQLETGHPGGGGWVGVNQGGRASRPAQKPWRSQFNQFKIEPLLIRNAPSVEVNTAMAANRRRANQVAAIIVRNSLLVNQSPYHNLSIHQTDHPSHDILTHHSTTPPYHHTTHSPRLIHSTQAPNTHQHISSSLNNVTHNQTTKDTIASSSSNANPLTHSSLINQPEKPRDDAIRNTTSSSEAPSSFHAVPHFTHKRGNTSKPFDNSPGSDEEESAKKRDFKKANNTSDGKTENGGNDDDDDKNKKKGINSDDHKPEVHEDNDDILRRRFFNKLECDDVPGDDCDTKHLYAYDRDSLIGKPLAHGEEPVHTHNHDTNELTHNKDEVDNNNNNINNYNNDNNNNNNNPNDNRVLESDTPEKSGDDDTTVRTNEEAIDRGSEPLSTEFSETEKDFEPLYLREDDDYAPSGEKTTESPTSEPPTRKTLTEDQLRKLPMCPEIPPGLMGHLDINLDCLEQLRLTEVLKELEWVMPGGKWSPAYEPTNPCLPRHKVAVVLPYRDRLHHLIILLSWLHPILRRQQLEYTIYVAEQAGNATFNKGSIMNAGFMEAWQRSDANCFVFHDVDLLPEDDRNMYSCPPQPRHLSVGVDTLGYKLPYFLLVGGVLSVRGDHFLRLNGYSNMYWGWGGEDDDMGYRIKQSGLSITRPPNLLARYTMIRHLKRRPLTWKVRGKLVRTSGRRYRLDGLNTLKYSLLALHKHPLFTHLLLDVGTPPENLVRLDAH